MFFKIILKRNNSTATFLCTTEIRNSVVYTFNSLDADSSKRIEGEVKNWTESCEEEYDSSHLHKAEFTWQVSIVRG